nr:MAG TPA: hypothetical protein [Caudoviricetes sp.]
MECNTYKGHAVAWPFLDICGYLKTKRHLP